MSQSKLALAQGEGGRMRGSHLAWVERWPECLVLESVSSLLSLHFCQVSGLSGNLGGPQLSVRVARSFR